MVKRLSPLKVGLIGFFGVGAWSDDLINDATQRILRSLEPGVEFDDKVMWKCMQGGRVDLEYLNNFDILVLGGGSLLGKCTFSPMNSIEKWAGGLEVSLFIFGTGYRFEPKFDPLLPEMKRRMSVLFETAKLIMLRGRKSFHYCRLNGIPVENVKAFGEPIIGAGYSRPQSLRKVIGGNVRDMPQIEVQYTSNDEVHRLMAGIYDWLIEETGMPLELVTWRGEDDLRGAVKTLGYMKRQAVTVRHLSLQEMLGSMDFSFWFGQRCHPAVYCAAVGVPFMGFDCQFEKMPDFLSIHQGGHYISAREGLTEFKESYREAVDTENLAKLRASVERNAEEIRGFARLMMEAAR